MSSNFLPMSLPSYMGGIVEKKTQREIMSLWKNGSFFTWLPKLLVPLLICERLQLMEVIYIDVA